MDDKPFDFHLLQGRALILGLMDQGLNDDELRSELGDDMDAEIAAARRQFDGDGQRQHAHAKTGLGAASPNTNAPKDGAALLDEVRAFIGRFVVYPTEHDQDAHALWIAHTHAMEAWESTPRIAFLSPEPASGKTRALEVMEPLVPRPVEAVNVSPAYLFRKVASEDGRPTILFDEIDTVFGPKAKENEEIRGLLNAGHRKGAVAGAVCGLWQSGEDGRNPRILRVGARGPRQPARYHPDTFRCDPHAPPRCR